MNRIASLDKNIRIVWCTAWVGVKKMIRSAAFYTIVFLAVLFWFLFDWNIKSLAADTGSAVAPHLLSLFYACTGNYDIYGLLLIVLMTCGAPFLDDSRNFTLQRTGKLSWCIGQMVYIFLANLILQAVMFAAQILTLFPYVTWSTDWGGTIRDAAGNPELLTEYHGFGYFYDSIVSGMSAMDALLQQIVLCTLLGSFIGAAVFLINGLFRFHVGAILAAAGAVLTGYLDWMDDILEWPISNYLPYNWVNLTYYVDGTYDFQTNVRRLCLLFLIFAVAGCVCVKKGWIRTTE